MMGGEITSRSKLVILLNIGKKNDNKKNMMMSVASINDIKTVIISIETIFDITVLIIMISIVIEL